MDNDISRWILDFIIQTSTSGHLIKKTLATIPVSDKDHRLKKTVLLRTIEGEISDAVVTETILEILEMIEELDRGEGIAVMESMKAAYCAVAVECTVKYLVGGIDRNGKFINAVKKIWRGRVTRMEGEGKSELVSRELKGWKDEVETAVWDKDVLKKLTYVNTRNYALRLVGEYLSEAWAILGPSFLELTATLIDKEMENRGIELPWTNFAELERHGGKEVIREGGRTGIDYRFEEFGVVANNAEVREVDTETAENTEVQGSVENLMTDRVSERRVLDDHNRSLGGIDKHAAQDEENLKIRVLPRRKYLASHKRTRGGAKISNPENSEDDTSSGEYRRLLTPEINRVQEALKVSSLDLQSVVNDPLPDALRASEAVISNLAENNKSHEHSSENKKDAANPATNQDAEPLQSWNAALENACGGHQKTVLQRSLMERNRTACRYEWDDSIDNSPERIGNHTSRLHLPSPKRRAVSPLKKYEITNVVRRRKVKKWSLLEEDTLRTGVEKFGKGNWKLILNSHRDVFEERTEVDLKDKWRNLFKY